MATQPRDIDEVLDASVPIQPALAPQLTAGEFNTALVHLYRGEISRANTWRTRLDGTTNWAVLTTGATLSFAFSSPGNTHVMILLNSLLISFFLYIEARRYRYYDLWRARIRLMETEFFADLLMTQDATAPRAAWREMLSAELLQPHFAISMWEAVGRRLRRNYSWIFAVLVLSWMIKIAIHPTIARDWSTIMNRASIGPIPGLVVIGAGVVFNSVLIAFGLLTTTRFTRRGADSEVSSRDDTLRSMSGERKWWE